MALCRKKMGGNADFGDQHSLEPTDDKVTRIFGLPKTQ